VRQLPAQDNGEPEVDAAPVRRLPTREGDLGPDAPLAERGRQMGPLLDARGLQGDGEPGLRRGHGVLQ
jgi:hypothetical protein